MENNKHNYLDLLHHISKRQTGKSTLLQVGIKNYDRPFLFVCENIQRGKFETDNNPMALYVTKYNIHTTYGNGDLPIIFSHDILQDMLKRLCYLESFYELKKQNHE